MFLWKITNIFHDNVANIWSYDDIWWYMMTNADMMTRYNAIWSHYNDNNLLIIFIGSFTRWRVGWCCRSRIFAAFGRTLCLLEDEGRPSSNNNTPLLLLNFKLTCYMYCYYWKKTLNSQCTTLCINVALLYMDSVWPFYFLYYHYYSYSFFGACNYVLFKTNLICWLITDMKMNK